MLREDARQVKEMTEIKKVELARMFSAGSHGRFLVVSCDGDHKKGHYLTKIEYI